MAEDTEDTGIETDYQPAPYVPTTSTTAETEQGGTRAAPAPAPRPPTPRPGPAAPPPPKPPAPAPRPSFFTPWRIAVGIVLVGGAAYAAYELTPRKGRR